MNKEDKKAIKNLIEDIEIMFPYRKALVFNPKVNYIVKRLTFLAK